MPSNRLISSAVLAASLLLQACSTAPVEEAPTEPARVPEEVPELTLNLPDGSCVCEEAPKEDYTFLERGFTSLAAGEHIEAVQHFQRYQRLEKTPEAELEAGIAIAYISILPNSPFYDTEEARKSYRRLRVQPTEGMEMHQQTLLMRKSLETFLQMERKMIELGEDNAKLEKSLKKREEALKRLRELTLGQSGG